MFTLKMVGFFLFVFEVVIYESAYLLNWASVRENHTLPEKWIKYDYILLTVFFF